MNLHINRGRQRRLPITPRTDNRDETSDLIAETTKEKIDREGREAAAREKNREQKFEEYLRRRGLLTEKST